MKHSLRRKLLIAGSCCILLLFALVFWAFVGEPYLWKVKKLRQGMTTNEVAQIFGKPTGTLRLQTNGKDSLVWVYNQNFPPCWLMLHIEFDDHGKYQGHWYD